MKKVFKFALSTMALLTLFSCGSKKDDTSLTKLDTEIVVQAEESWVPYYEKAIERVKEKYPEAKIEIKKIPSFDHLDLITQTDVTNKDVADVFAYPLDRFDGLQKNDVLAVIDSESIAKEIGAEKVLKEGLSQQLVRDGKFLGFPFNIETLIAIINKENAKKANVELGDTIELTKLGDLQFLVPMFNAWWAVAITNAFDIELLEKTKDGFRSDLVKDYKDLTSDQQQMFKGMFEYWQMATRTRSNLFDLKQVYGYLDSEFETGKKGIVRIAGPWEIPPISEKLGDNLEIRDLNSLTFEGKALKHWQGGWALGVNARDEEDSAKLKLAEELIKELMNPKYAVDLYKVSGKIMPNATIETYENSDLSKVDKEVIKAVINSYEKSQLRPIFNEWGGVWDTWQNALLSWNTKKPNSVEEAYKLVQESFKSLLETVK